MSDGRNVPADVMQTTLDKFLSLVEQQNRAYNSMGAAVESVSNTVRELVGKISILEKQIADEQLAEVMADSVEQFQTGITEVRDALGCLPMTEEQIDDLHWFLSGVRWVRKRFVLIVFISGSLIMWIGLRAGLDVTGFIKGLFKGMLK